MQKAGFVKTFFFFIKKGEPKLPFQKEGWAKWLLIHTHS